MKINQTTSTGHLKISEEVIGAIVKQTVMEMEGVAGLALVPVSKRDYLLKAKKPKQIMIENRRGRRESHPGYFNGKRLCDQTHSGKCAATGKRSRAEYGWRRCIPGEYLHRRNPLRGLVAPQERIVP